MKHLKLNELLKEQDTSICVSDDPENGAAIEGYPNPISFLLCEEIVRRAYEYDKTISILSEG